MHAWVRRALCAAGLTGGILLLGIGIAEAASADGDNGPTTDGQNAIVSGNQTGVDAQAPIDLSGNQVTVIGHDNEAGSAGGATTSGPSAGSGGATTSGQDGTGAGNQTGVDAQAPVDVSGNQLTVIGHDNTITSTGGSSTGGGSTPPGETTTGEGGVGSGNQTPIAVQAPVDVSGNQVTVIGHDNLRTSPSGTSAGGMTPVTGPPGDSTNPPGSGATPSAPQAGGAPGQSVLPSTGAGSVLGLGVIGVILLTAGLVLGRPRRLTVR